MNSHRTKVISSYLMGSYTNRSGLVIELMLSSYVRAPQRASVHLYGIDRDGFREPYGRLTVNDSGLEEPLGDWEICVDAQAMVSDVVQAAAMASGMFEKTGRVVGPLCSEVWRILPQKISPEARSAAIDVFGWRPQAECLAQQDEDQCTYWLYLAGNPIASVRLHPGATDYEVRAAAMVSHGHVPLSEPIAPASFRIMLHNAEVRRENRGQADEVVLVQPPMQVERAEPLKVALQLLSSSEFGLPGSIVACEFEVDAALLAKIAKAHTTMQAEGFSEIVCSLAATPIHRAGMDDDPDRLDFMELAVGDDSVQVRAGVRHGEDLHSPLVRPDILSQCFAAGMRRVVLSKDDPQLLVDGFANTHAEEWSGPEITSVSLDGVQSGPAAVEAADSGQALAGLRQRPAS